MKVYNIPAGSANLSAMFPNLDFSNIKEYNLEGYGESQCGFIVNDECFNANGEPLIINDESEGGSEQIFHTPTFFVKHCSDGVRVHFINFLGKFDVMQFETINRDIATESDSYIKYQSPGDYDKRSGGAGRLNVIATTVYEVSEPVDEKDGNWLTEILSSPLAYIEWKGVQGQPSSYLPIIINDASYRNRKSSERFNYEFVLKFTIGKSKNTLR